MGGAQEQPRRWRKELGKARRRIRKFLRRGVGYQIGRIVWAGLIIFTALFYGLFLYIYAFSTGAVYRLDWNTVISIVLADLPVGLVLWWVLDRRDSKNRRILDGVERMKVKALFSHLEVHYSDPWGSAEYPYLHYYVVNTKTKLAYRVDDDMAELIEAELVKVYPRHRDLVVLNLHFEGKGWTIQHNEPEGDDLSLGVAGS